MRINYSEEEDFPGQFGLWQGNCQRSFAQYEDIFRTRSECADNLSALLPALEEAIQRERENAARLQVALNMLYDETADYIRINNLGDVYHNRSMQLAFHALARAPAELAKPVDEAKVQS